MQRLAGDRQVAEGTLLPHPYEGGTARAWIWDQALAYAAGKSIDFAIELTEDGALAGAIGLEIDRVGACAKLGLWLGRAYWGRGYATEAVNAVLGYGFAVLELERIWAPRFRWNAASARVLQKAGLAQEGRRREYVAARAREETIETHGILRWEWEAQRRPQGVCARGAASGRGSRPYGLVRLDDGNNGVAEMGFVQARRQPVRLAAPAQAISVRHAEASDADALHGIFTDPEVMHWLIDVPYAPQAQTRKHIVELPDGRYMLVAVDGGELVGALGFGAHTAPRIRHVGRLGPIAVARARQGRGVGSALMRAAVDLADNWLNLVRLELLVIDGNDAAIGLYRRFGFEVEGTLRAFGFQAGRYVDVHTMARVRNAAANA